MIGKKWFCSHVFDLFYEENYYSFTPMGKSEKWHYICKKCGKESTILQEDIQRLYEKYKKQAARERALGDNQEAYRHFEYKMGDRLYREKAGFYLGRHFWRYHQKRKG